MIGETSGAPAAMHPHKQPQIFPQKLTSQRVKYSEPLYPPLTKIPTRAP